MKVINVFSNAFVQRQEGAQAQLRRARPGRGRVTRPMERSIARFFRGSELPRLLRPGGRHGRRAGPLVWHFAQHGARAGRAAARGRGERPSRSCPTARPSSRPSPTGRPMSFRDNAAYAHAARPGPRAGRPPSSPRRAAATSCSPTSGSVPSTTAACPSTCSARPCGSLRYESKLSKTGWLYEAWIITPDAAQISLTSASSRTPPKGFPIGAERLRAGRLQRLLPQDHEVPGRRRRPRRAACSSAGSAGSPPRVVRRRVERDEPDPPGR